MGLLHWLRQAFLFVLLVILVPLAVTGLWARATLLQTDRYVAAVGPLAEEPAVQAQVTARVMAYLDGLVTGSDSGSAVRNRLVRATYDQFRSQIQDGVGAVVASGEFADLWIEANRTAHPRLVDLLTGDQPAGADGRVELDLLPVFERAKERLAASSITILENIQPGDGELTMTLFQSDDLDQYRQYVRWFEIGVFLIAAAAVILGVFFVWGARSTMLGIAGLCLIVAIAMAVVWVELRVGRELTAGRIADPGSREAAEAIYDGVMGRLRDRLWPIGVAGLFAAIVFWLIQRARPKPVYIR